MFAQSQPPASSTANFRAGRYGVSSELVLINVSVVTEHGQPIRGLPAAGFHVLEHGVEQKLVSFSEEDVPVSIVFVLDESGSMKGEVQECVRAINLLLKNAGPSDEFSLVTFADRAVINSEFTHEDNIQSSLLQTTSHGRTALLDAIRLAASVTRRAHNERKVVIVLSDGGDNLSRYTESEIRQLLAEDPVQVYAINIGAPAAGLDFVPEIALDPVLLERICDFAGGRCIRPESSGALPRAMLQLADETRSQYVLGFRPADQPHDNRLHTVRVKLSSADAPRHASLFWRRGYYESSVF